MSQGNGEVSSLEAHRRRHEINQRYDNMIANFKSQYHMGAMMLHMELQVRIAVAQSNRDTELRDLESLD